MRNAAIFSLAIIGTLTACGSTPPRPTDPAGAHPASTVDLYQHAKDVIAATDRDPTDRVNDAARKPAEVLSFCGVGPDMTVAELGAGSGYTTEILARIVGPKGKVYAQNPPTLIERFLKLPWEARLAKPVNKNVVRYDSEFDAPLPEGAKNLDVVVIVLFYHDTVWLKSDRTKMNASVFAALKPGGHYCVIDHASAPGRGIEDAQTLHRIEASVVKSEVMAAGFGEPAESDVLRNPADAHDWNDSPREAGARRGTSDRFVLRFTKPGK